MTGTLYLSSVRGGYTLAQLDFGSVLSLAEEDTMQTAFVEMLTPDTVFEEGPAKFEFMASNFASAFPWEMDTTAHDFGFAGLFKDGVAFTGAGEFLMIGHLYFDLDQRQGKNNRRPHSK